MASSSNRKLRRRARGLARRLEHCAREVSRRGCLVCRAEGPGAVMTWAPSPELARRLAGPDGRKPAYVYKLCPDCVRRGPALSDRIEEIILAQAGHILVPASSN